MNKLNAVIFDLDGVICFTDKYHFQAWKKLADEEGMGTAGTGSCGCCSRRL